MKAWGASLIKIRLAVLIALLLLVFAISPIIAYHFYTEYKFWESYGLQIQEDLVKEQDLTMRLTDMIQEHCLSPKGLDDLDWVSNTQKKKDNIAKKKKTQEKKKPKAKEANK